LAGLQFKNLVHRECAKVAKKIISTHRVEKTSVLRVLRAFAVNLLVYSELQERLREAHVADRAQIP
jgi:hypothetical protein